MKRDASLDTLAYDYNDAVTLLTDFWSDVKAVLKERGVMK